MADITMLDLPVAVSLSGDEYFWVVQGGTDKRAEVGLVDAAVIAFHIATQAEAEAATNNTKIMTPLRVAQEVQGATLFTQSGSSAVARTIISKLREYISVTDFGATGNGTTNDRAAIVAANAAAAGRAVYFPPGTYIIDSGSAGSAITMSTANVEWFGAGPGSALKLANAATSTEMLTITGANFTLRDMSLNGNRFAATGGRGITLQSSGALIQNVSFTDIANIALAITGSSALRNRAEDCNFSNNHEICRIVNTAHDNALVRLVATSGTYGIKVYDNAAAQYCYRTSIVGCRISDLTGLDPTGIEAGISVVGGPQTIIAGNFIGNIGSQRGIECFQFSPGTTISGNEIFNVGVTTGLSAIDVGPNNTGSPARDDEISICGNVIDTCGGAGVILSGGHGCVVNDNVIRNPASNAVAAALGLANGITLCVAELVITDNRVLNCAVSGNYIVDDRGGSAVTPYGIAEVDPHGTVYPSTKVVGCKYAANTFKGMVTGNYKIIGADSVAIELKTGNGTTVVLADTPAIATPILNGSVTGTGVASANTVSTLVKRDGSGNFAAGTITANLTGNATTATTAVNATNITTANDTTTNTTYYPTFQTAISGTNPLKTSDSKLTYNPSTGTLSATTFAGTLVGAAAAGSLSGTTLAANVVTSSLTAVGTLGTGVWQASVIDSTYGGTGVNNAGRTLTINTNSGTFAFPGAATVHTLPSTTSTLARTDAGQTFTGTNVFGVLQATSFNGNTFTAGTGTLTIAASKTLTANSSLTLAGTDGKTLTVSNSGTLAGGDAFVLAIAAGKTFTVSNTLTVTATDGSTLAAGAGGTLVATAYSTDAANLTGTLAAARLPSTIPQILAHSAVGVSHTGTTAETTLATINIPANTMGANGMLRIMMQWGFTGTNVKQPRVRFGGTELGQVALTTQLAASMMTMISNRNATNVQLGMPLNTTGYGAPAAANTTGAIDTTASANVTITGELSNSGESITLENYIVELIRP